MDATINAHQSRAESSTKRVSFKDLLSGSLVFLMFHGALDLTKAVYYDTIRYCSLCWPPFYYPLVLQHSWAKNKIKLNPRFIILRFFIWCFVFMGLVLFCFVFRIYLSFGLPSCFPDFLLKCS